VWVGMAVSASFHRNVLLNQLVPPDHDFKKIFCEVNTLFFFILSILFSEHYSFLICLIFLGGLLPVTVTANVLQGMFDKPNTTGFIYVSHYLLTIFDVERFKKLVEWPVICKKTETKYRNNVKDLSECHCMENPDMGFLCVVITYLYHASGTKFMTIMWKLSQLTLRTYIMRDGRYLRNKILAVC